MTAQYSYFLIVNSENGLSCPLLIRPEMAFELPEENEITSVVHGAGT